MYSLMSSWISASSSSKRNSASALASSVFPTPVGPRKMNEPLGPLGVLQPGPGAADGTGQRLDGLFLADDPLVQLVLHAQELGGLLLGEAVDGDAGPVGQHLGDDLLVDDVEELDALGAPLGLHGRLAVEALLLLLGQLLRLVERLALDGRLLVACGSGRSPPRASCSPGGVVMRRMRRRLPASSMRSMALSGRYRSAR